MANIAEVELGLRPNGAGGYTVDLTSRPAGWDSDERLSAVALIDPDALRVNLSAEKYGRALGEDFFADAALRDGFARARSLAQGAGARLRIRLTIDSAAAKLHSVRWETLRDAAGAELFNGPDIWFSRYLALANSPAVVSRAAGMRALVVIANPTELVRKPNGLAPIPVQAERDLAEAGLSEAMSVPPTVLASIEGAAGKPTVAGIVDRLEEGYDVLYLVCHGAFLKDDPRLWLEKDDGTVDIVSASSLVAAFGRLENPVRLVVLASCESAGTSASADALTAFGPLLAAAGIPAVIAMQEKVSMAMIEHFMTKFFDELGQDGQIDRAMAAARGYAVTRGYTDYWMPVLFMRLRSGSLWAQPGFGGTQDLERWTSIRTALEEGHCTPILGPGMVEEIVGSTRQIARQLAASYGFPLAPWALDDLPTVMQYLAVKLGGQFPRSALGHMIRDGLLSRFGKELPGDFDRTDLNSVFGEVGKMRRSTRKLEAHRQLASKPFSVYITVNPDEMMEDALREAGREPRSEFSRWNETISDVDEFPTLAESEPKYKPSVREPLVYHVYGKLAVPESLVITEDDYFDFLLRIGSKADGKNLAPSAVGRALTRDALLFIGFRLEDWSFRVLLRSIYSKNGSGARKVGNETLPCVGAQLLPEKGRIIEAEGTRKYFEKYLGISNIDIFWGRSDDFVRELDRQTSGLAVAAKAI